MKACDYPEIEEHQEVHKTLLDEINKFFEQAHNGLTSEQKKLFRSFYITYSWI
jgi:hemerythrin